MLKNEQQRVHVTLNSIKDAVDSLIVYDTGSTDDTIPIVTSFAKQHRIPLHLKQGTFTNFAESRNVSLDFADTVPGVDFLLLLDCNDELRGGNALRTWAKKQPPTSSAWLMRQYWFHGESTDFYNIRFIRPRCSWRYNGVVHEWIQKQDQPDIYITDRIPPEAHIYQNRTEDDDKSGKRFVRDRELLLQEYERDPTDTRTVFYLAQTCACLQLHEEAYKYYDIRRHMGGFNEEVFQSTLRMAILIRDIQRTNKEYTDDQMVLLCINAFTQIPRVEPLLLLAEHYRGKEQWMAAYMYAKMACDLDRTSCILFVNEQDYTYKRYHILGIIAFYCGKYNEGRQACLKAIQANGPYVAVDKHNLAFYNEKLKITPASAERIGKRRVKRR